ncbi:MAG TPA: hypothetical protein DCZ95_03475 [Verrucomicrobia bacterium]|nr:MAG: hypothetical protein A2X46_01490 [Lentisphaerae bacterium GWF2_57_35]HBA83134.1 hypothetical protein [Verrucomicrobiota bacterium]
MNQEWNIKSRNEACQKCNKSFADGETFYSRLTFGEEGYAREDRCEPCWKAEAGDKSLSVWKTVFKAPPPPSEETLKKETAESLLRQLMETDNPAHRNVIYILAVMLERRRILIERDVQVREDGLKIRVYEHKKSQETFLVPDPELRLTELTQVQEEVLAMLGVAHAPAEKPAPAPELAPDPVPANAEQDISTTNEHE